MKVGSFCSITSEGDGDIFDSSGTGQLKEEDEDEMEDLAMMSLPVGDATSPCRYAKNRRTYMFHPSSSHDGKTKALNSAGFEN